MENYLLSHMVEFIIAFVIGLITGIVIVVIGIAKPLSVKGTVEEKELNKEEQEELEKDFKNNLITLKWFKENILQRNDLVFAHKDFYNFDYVSGKINYNEKMILIDNFSLITEKVGEKLNPLLLFYFGMQEMWPYTKIDYKEFLHNLKKDKPDVQIFILTSGFVDNKKFQTILQLKKEKIIEGIVERE